jgi:hypothetical protein
MIIPVDKFTWTDNVGITDRSDLGLPAVSAFAVQGKRRLLTFTHWYTKRDELLRIGWRCKFLLQGQ